MDNPEQAQPVTSAAELLAKMKLINDAYPLWNSSGREPEYEAVLKRRLSELKADFLILESASVEEILAIKNQLREMDATLASLGLVY